MNLNYFDQTIDKIINNNNSPKSESIFFFKKKEDNSYIYMMCMYLKISFKNLLIQKQKKHN